MIKMPSAQEVADFFDDHTLTAASLPSELGQGIEEDAQAVDGEPTGVQIKVPCSLEILAAAKELPDNACYVLSITAGPFHKLRKHNGWPRPKEYLAQSFLCVVVDNKCEVPYLRRQEVFDVYGSRGIEANMISAYLASRRQLDAPAELFGKESVQTLRPGFVFSTDRPFLARVAHRGFTVQVGGGIRFSADGEDGVGRVISIRIRPSSLNRGPFRIMNPLGQEPQHQHLYCEIVRLYTGSQVKAVGEQLGKGDIIAAGSAMLPYQVFEGRLGDCDGRHAKHHMVPFGAITGTVEVHTPDLFTSSMCDTGEDLQVVGAFYVNRAGSRAIMSPLHVGDLREAARQTIRECAWGLRGNGFARDMSNLRSALHRFVLSKARSVNNKTLQWLVCCPFRWEALVVSLGQCGLLDDPNLQLAFSGGVHQCVLPGVQQMADLTGVQLGELSLGDGLGTLELQGRVALRFDLNRPGKLLVSFERLVKMHGHGLGSTIDTDNNPRKARRMFNTTVRHAVSVPSTL